VTVDECELFEKMYDVPDLADALFAAVRKGMQRICEAELRLGGDATGPHPNKGSTKSSGKGGAGKGSKASGKAKEILAAAGLEQDPTNSAEPTTQTANS